MNFSDRIIFNLIERYPAFTERLVNHFLARRYELPVTPTHYYSPLPDIPALKKKLARWHKKSAFHGIDLNTNHQMQLLTELEIFRNECKALPDLNELTSRGYGQGYAEVDAHFLHCMIRHFKPKKVIEVGSGVSTFYTMNALDKNKTENKSHADLICIEPYPSAKLTEIQNEGRISLIPKEVQDIDIDLFSDLKSNDLLFIDSSHVSKVDSDVNFLYLEVLPRLEKGVLIHIHDIPLPYLTAMPDHPLFNLTLMWNEPAFVKAFLMFNSAFEILMFQSYLHIEFPEEIKRVVELYDPKVHFPTSVWLRRKI